MAIAPVMEQGQFDLYENPWPRPHLRVVEQLPNRVEPTHTQGMVIEFPPKIAARPIHGVRGHVPRSTRRAVVFVVGLLIVLALATPIRALGGVTVTGQQTPGGLPSGLIPGEPYTVQAGDTIASIAGRLGAPAFQAKLESEIKSEIGSDVVVPGEQISLP